MDEIPKCEKCDQPARMMILTKLVELRPVQDEHCNWWSCKKPAGPYVPRCSTHNFLTEHVYSEEFLEWQKEMAGKK